MNVTKDQLINLFSDNKLEEYLNKFNITDIQYIFQYTTKIYIENYMKLSKYIRVEDDANELGGTIIYNEESQKVKQLYEDTHEKLVNILSIIEKYIKNIQKIRVIMNLLKIVENTKKVI